MSCEIFGCTHRGCLRELNEDHVLVGRFVKNRGEMSLTLAMDDDFLARFGLLLAVADGIGGENAGEVASRMALSTLERHFFACEKAPGDVEAFSEILGAGGRRANEAIMQRAAGHPDMARMGCTLTGVCLLPGNKYLVFNAGDSRVARFRGKYLTQLTDDETLARMADKLPASLVPSGAAMATHTLTNSLGTADFTLTVQAGPSLLAGDMVLVYSDGLYDMVPIDRLEELLAQGGDIAALGRCLLHAALEAGGEDNISLVLLRVTETDGEQSDSGETVAEEQRIA
ncbi:MAG: hypothetical protein BWK76_09925 [Desulfobulbaceae bacterium A2]|nr:MAG: hypothetical protein BWK76_09925 [Desulfobulbaceae bacterium A2]